MKKSTPSTSDKKSLVMHIVLTVLFLFLAFFFYATQLVYPFHFVLAFGFLYLTYRHVKKLFIYFNVGKEVKYLSEGSKRIPRSYKIFIGVCLGLVFVWYVVVSVIPNDKDIFTSLSSEAQTEIVDKDITEALVLLDMLVISSNELLDNPSFSKTELTQEEGLLLKKQWETFLSIALQSEAITDKHRYFSQISFFSNKETHTKSFVIAYALYMKKFELFHKIIAQATVNPLAIKLFNEYSEAFGQANLYDDVSTRFFASNSFLRRNLGYVYFQALAPSNKRDVTAEYAPLLDVAEKSYEYIFKNFASQVTHRTLTYKYTFDKTMFGAWLPIQKTVFVNTFGNIHVGDRKEKFITVEQINEMKPKLQPGDILVYRKNWYASNLGVPGFWTHTGLYTGTLTDMDEFFAPLFPYKGYDTFSALMQKEYPKVYEVYSTPDKNSFMPSVIESQTHGTLVQSLQTSAYVDYFGVMRTKLEKKDILESLTGSFSHYGKPYDFSFDFDTKSEIFCSELVYDAYLGSQNKKGILLPRIITAGRSIVIPNGLVEKLAKESGKENQEIFFVYFLDAFEETGKAFVSTEKAFIESAERPKYSSLQK